MRLLEGLRLKVEKIEANGTNLQLLQRSLTPLLYAPLKRLRTTVKSDEDFECTILKEVRYLEVLENYPYQIRPPVVLNLQNLNFHKISRLDNSWSADDFLLIFKNWVESGKKVRSCYSFGTSEHVKNTILGKITEEYKDAETGDAFISIPTRFNNQVEVSVEEGHIFNQWVVKLEVYHYNYKNEPLSTVILSEFKKCSWTTRSEYQDPPNVQNPIDPPYRQSSSTADSKVFGSQENRFKINDTEYEVMVYKKYHGVNKTGSALTDLDQYGFEDDSGKNILTPGDVDLRDESLTVATHEPGYHQREERIPDLEKTLGELRRKLKFVESFGPIPKRLRRGSDYQPFEHQKQLEVFLKGTGNTIINERCPEFEGARKMAHYKLSQDIKNQLAKLQPFYSRRDGVPVPYGTFLQFSVTSPRQKHAELVQYSKKLHEAAKYLSTRLFGNRSHPVYIKLLNPCWNAIMRLPVGLQLKIEEIELHVINIHLLQRSLTPLLDAPLKRLITIVNNDDDFKCSILQEARYLKVLENLPYQILPPVVLNLQNLKFHMVSQIENSWSVEDFLLVIKNWAESGKKVGSCYSFGTSEHVKNTILGKITEAYENAETGDEFISIPTRFNNQVKVSIEEGHGFNRWVLKFEVLPSEQESQ